MLKALDFHTPTFQVKPHSILEWVEDRADSYLSVTNKVAHIIPDRLHNQHPVVEITKTPWTFGKVILTAMKVMSYVLFILPSLALLLKIHKKYTHTYYINEPLAPLQKPNLTTPKEIPYDKWNPIDNLEKKDAWINHYTITQTLHHYKKEVFEKEKKFFFIEHKDATSLQQPFSIIRNSKTPAHMKEPYPIEGGICISIHRDLHFVSLFVSFKEKKIVYYDSFAHPMDKTMKDFIQKVKKTAFKPKEKVELISVNAGHQHDGNNCGRYTINFLKEMMESSNLNQTIAKLKEKTISSDEIHKEGIKWSAEIKALRTRQPS